MRIGIGYDSHRIEPGGTMLLGGVAIEQGRHFVGHSDADVLLHAITDALLSAQVYPTSGNCFPTIGPRIAVEILRKC